MPSGHPYDLPRVYNFRVDFDLPGTTELDIRFREVSGLSMELETETITEGGENRFAHILPVRASSPDAVLKRGLVAESAVTTWIRDAVQTLIIRPTTVTVQLLSPSQEPLRVFTLHNAWPKKWSVSDLAAETNDVAVEELTLCYAFLRET